MLIDCKRCRGKGVRMVRAYSRSIMVFGTQRTAENWVEEKCVTCGATGKFWVSAGDPFPRPMLTFALQPPIFETS